MLCLGNGKFWSKISSACDTDENLDARRNFSITSVSLRSTATPAMQEVLIRVLTARPKYDSARIKTNQNTAPIHPSSNLASTGEWQDTACNPRPGKPVLPQCGPRRGKWYTNYEDQRYEGSQYDLSVSICNGEI